MQANILLQSQPEITWSSTEVFQGRYNELDPKDGLY